MTSPHMNSLMIRRYPSATTGNQMGTTKGRHEAMSTPAGPGGYPGETQQQPQQPQGQPGVQGGFPSGGYAGQHTGGYTGQGGQGGPGVGERVQHVGETIGRHVKTPETKEFFKT